MQRIVFGGFGFQSPGFEFRASDFEFRVSGFGFRDSEVRVGEREVVGELAGGGQRPGAVEPRRARCLHLDPVFGYQISGIRLHVPGFEFAIQGKDSGFKFRFYGIEV